MQMDIIENTTKFEVNNMQKTLRQNKTNKKTPIFVFPEIYV